MQRETIQAQTINAENFSTIQLVEDHYFKYCTFEGLSPEGGHITSDFNTCTFQRIDWYWGLFNISTFVKCQFTDCVFRGSSFSGCLLVECTLKNCQFLEDNLGGDCGFEDTIAYGCKVENTVGFGATIV